MCKQFTCMLHVHVYNVACMHVCIPVCVLCVLHNVPRNLCITCNVWAIHLRIHKNSMYTCVHCYYKCVNRDYKCVNRDYKCVNCYYKCVNRDYKCVNRDYKCVNRDYKCVNHQKLLTGKQCYEIGPRQYLQGHVINCGPHYNSLTQT